MSSLKPLALDSGNGPVCCEINDNEWTSAHSSQTSRPPYWEFSRGLWPPALGHQVRRRFTEFFSDRFDSTRSKLMILFNDTYRAIGFTNLLLCTASIEPPSLNT